MANEIQYRNHTAYNNGTSAENNIKLLDITPFQHEDLSSGVNKLGKMLVAQSFCEPVAVCNSNNPQNGVYVATCQNYPDFALSYQDAQQNTQYLIGLKIRVIFTYGITYGSVSSGTYPTLNINGSGAIPMLAQGKTMATGSASAGQTLEFTVIPYGNGIAFDADSNVRESTSDYTIYTDGSITYTAGKIQGSYQPKILQDQFDNFADLTAFIDSNFSIGIRIGGVAIQGTSDPNSPITEIGYYWWNIITFGVSNRITQIAVQAYIGYAYTNYMYVREKHDNQWSGWVKV